MLNYKSLYQAKCSYPLFGCGEKNTGKKIRRKMFSLMLLDWGENEMKENEKMIVFFCLVEEKSKKKENYFDLSDKFTLLII